MTHYNELAISSDTLELLTEHYIQRFCSKHDVQFEGWVGERVGEWAYVGDTPLFFDWILFDVLSKQPKKKIWLFLESGFSDYPKFCEE